MTAVLQVEDLKTHFFTRAGIVPAVDGVSFTVNRGEVMGLVGESGSGKTVTGFSIMGMVDKPGRIVGGRILYQGRDLASVGEREWQAIRGRHIAMIFQDPMMTLNPVLKISTQMIEAVQAHVQISKEAARALPCDTGARRHPLTRRTDGRLSAPVLGGDAPARGYRHRPAA